MMVTSAPETGSYHPMKWKVPRPRFPARFHEWAPARLCAVVFHMKETSGADGEKLATEKICARSKRLR
jgi:hypothetical protein